MEKPIEAILIGAGNRGAQAYAPYALRHPDELRFTAVAEPDERRRSSFSAQHGIPPERQFTSWEPMLAQTRFAQAALVCTQDQYHTAPALAALQTGYEVLLEKPMATTAEECRLLVESAEQNQRQLHICHVLRYTPHFRKMYEIVKSGILGQIVNVTQHENVSWWHMAHSYVRGNWANREQSSPMILAKCCHDLDILLWLLGRKVERLSSSGSLIHFRPENAPPGATQFCLDGCPAADTCPYYAPFIYVDLLPLWRSFSNSADGFNRFATLAQERYPGLVKLIGRAAPPLRQLSDYRGWPCNVVTQDPTPENLLSALRQGPYGRCVYHCSNTVVDTQVVLMEFEGGLPVTLTMFGHAHTEHRSTRIEGTRASLTAHFGIGGAWIEVNEHRSDRSRRYDTGGNPESGHGGGDEALMAAFIQSLRTGGESALTTARQALASHLLAFAAEEARLEGSVIDTPMAGAGFRLPD